MNSTQLLYFVEAVKNNSMRKAAKVLNTTQPNVSSSIAALERETGVRLLVRTNKGIELTHEGQRFYSIALGVTDRMVVLKRMFHVTNESENFILNIASNPSLITTEVLAELQKNNPYERFIITVRNHSVMACANSVRAAESEIGIVFITSGYNTHYKKVFADIGLDYTPTSIKPYCINIGPNNPYYHQETITRQEIIQFPIARFIEDELSYLDFSISTEGIGMGNNHRVYYFNSDAQILDFVAQTNAYKVGNPWCREAYEEKGIRCLALVPDDGLPLELGWIKRKGHSLSPAACRFLEIFEKRFRD